jgi:DNA-binding CsgD family transcriptional regulator
MHPTRPQLEILVLHAAGLDRREIGVEMMISPLTVRNQIVSLRKRLRAENTPQALAICIARGYLCVDGRTERVYIPQPIDQLVA